MTSQEMPSTELILDMFRRMTLIRKFEDYLFQMFLQGLVPGTLHQYQGQEAVAVGVCSALRKDDLVFGTHRPAGHAIAKGGSLPALAAEIWGKTTGCCGGKGGQMHLMDYSAGAMLANAIVGANIPIATGAAIGFKLSGSDRVAVSFFGDGATNTGAFHEAINLAAVKNAPVIFVCENNLYAASTHMSNTIRVKDIAKRAESYALPNFTVDGMDVLAVYQSAKDAVIRARKGDGPTFLEYKTYRFCGHSRGDPGGYRSKEEVASWRERDAIINCRKLLISDCNKNEHELESIEKECQSEVEKAVEFALNSPEPSPEDCFRHVFAERSVDQ